MLHCPQAFDYRNLPDWSLWQFPEFGFSEIVADGGKSLTMSFYSDCQRSGPHPTSRALLPPDCRRAGE